MTTKRPFHSASHGTRAQFDTAINALARDTGDLVATFGDHGLALGTDHDANALYEEASAHVRKARTALDEFRAVTGVRPK